MHVLEKSGERQLFYAKHAKMCLILIIGVNYVSAFITSAPLFLTCCVEAPETSQGRESRLGRVRGRGQAGVSPAAPLLPAPWPSPSLRGEDDDGSFRFVLAKGGAGCGNTLAVSPQGVAIGRRGQGCCSDRRWARSWPGTSGCQLLLICPNCNFCFVGFFIRIVE